MTTTDKAQEAKEAIFAKCLTGLYGANYSPPRLAIVLGSGLGGAVSSLAGAIRISYADIPHFPHSTVPGHAGELAIGTLKGMPTVVMIGRVHVYEGYTPEEVTFPVRVLRALGAETLILTNAAGALTPSLQAGDVMLINDQINMMGVSPFKTKDVPQGERLFVDMGQAYDPQLWEIAADAASGLLPKGLRQGVYVGVRGPHYETPAEILFYNKMGGDAIGMSTVLEAIVARQLGMHILGLSCITNHPLAQRKTTHEEVVEASRTLEPVLATLLGRIARTLSNPT